MRAVALFSEVQSIHDLFEVKEALLDAGATITREVVDADTGQGAVEFATFDLDELRAQVESDERMPDECRIEALA